MSQIVSTQTAVHCLTALKLDTLVHYGSCLA